jgi:hypothetical protein
MVECQNYQKNLEKCNCTYEPCSRKGNCCQCISYHRSMNQAPACLFPAKVEATYDRNLETLSRAILEGRK